jgi:hypothetical protein
VNLTLYHPGVVCGRLERRISGIVRRLIPPRLLFSLYTIYAIAKIKRLLSEITDKKRLEHFGRQVYSQNEEDGIIAEIFRRIGATGKRFVEFGCGDGSENNTRLLLDQGWSGLWIDVSESNVEKAIQSCCHLISVRRLKILNEFITRENINDLISSDGHYRGEIDLLVIDIDGNDAHVWRAIDVVNPRVVCIEYNASCGPKRSWLMDYTPNFKYTYDGRNCFGASIKLLEDLGRTKRYALVGCSLSGVNAFFVRDDLVADCFVRGSAEEFFHPPRYRLKYAFRKAFA